MIFHTNNNLDDFSHDLETFLDFLIITFKTTPYVLQYLKEISINYISKFLACLSIIDKCERSSSLPKCYNGNYFNVVIRKSFNKPKKGKFESNI